MADLLAPASAQLRRTRRPAPVGLPHPSWRRAVGALPDPDGRKLASAAEFWAKVGV